MATMNTCGFALHAEARTITGCTREGLMPGTQDMCSSLQPFQGAHIGLEHFITNGINPKIGSDNRGLIALDWAKHGCNNRLGKEHADPLVQYMREIQGGD